MNDTTPGEGADKNVPENSVPPQTKPSTPYSASNPLEKYYKAPQPETKPIEPAPVNAPPPVITKMEDYVNKQNVVHKPFWLKAILVLFAIAIPASILFYLIYWNFLPFGFAKTYELVAGTSKDTSGEIYFEASRNLSERKKDTETYREIFGPVNIVFKPTAVLKNAYINVEVIGENIAVIPPKVNIDDLPINWDYEWDFSEETPFDFEGDAFSFDGCLQLDGSNRIAMKDSKDLFENGPFTVFAEWKPEDAEKNNQQIIGHYNWEIFQNKNNVTFQVGRMNDNKGVFYSVKAPVKPDFFNKKHRILATYSPSEFSDDQGYIEIYIDDTFAGRTIIDKDLIWADYGQNPLSLGRSAHNGEDSPFFKGCVYSAKIVGQRISEDSVNFDMKSAGVSTKMTIINIAATGTVRSVKIKANE